MRLDTTSMTHNFQHSFEGVNSKKIKNKLTERVATVIYRGFHSQTNNLNGTHRLC